MTLRKVAIAGVGYTIPRAASPELSYRELTYEAAAKAYTEAGIQAREVQCFTTCAEDINEGTSIFDEYVPDQLGAPLKPVHTVCGDGLYGLIAAYMQVLTGLFEIAVVEAHSKASNIVNYNRVLEFAFDPVFNRPLGFNPYYLAGLEMNRYLYETKTTLEQCCEVVIKNRQNALLNPSGVYGTPLTRADVLDSEEIAPPLTSLQVSQPSDVAVVLVLVSAEKLRRLRPTAAPSWIKGVGWCSETSWLETHHWTETIYAQKSAEQSYKFAGIKKPATEIDVFEIDDTLAYKELQHLEALKVCKKGEAGKLTARGLTKLSGDIPVNASGGCLGLGHMLEATGLFKVVEIVKQLRNEAGRYQVAKAKTGLAQSWRGLPTTSGAVVILEK